MWKLKQKINKYILLILLSSLVLNTEAKNNDKILAKRLINRFVSITNFTTQAVSAGSGSAMVFSQSHNLKRFFVPNATIFDTRVEKNYPISLEYYLLKLTQIGSIQLGSTIKDFSERGNIMKVSTQYLGYMIDKRKQKIVKIVGANFLLSPLERLQQAEQKWNQEKKQFTTRIRRLKQSNDQKYVAKIKELENKLRAKGKEYDTLQKKYNSLAKRYEIENEQLSNRQKTDIQKLKDQLSQVLTDFKILKSVNRRELSRRELRRNLEYNKQVQNYNKNNFTKELHKLLSSDTVKIKLIVAKSNKKDRVSYYLNYEDVIDYLDKEEVKFTVKVAGLQIERIATYQGANGKIATSRDIVNQNFETLPKLNGKFKGGYAEKFRIRALTIQIIDPRLL